MTSLSRKFYAALAAKFARLRPSERESDIAYQQWEAMVIGTVHVIEGANPSFNRELFLRASGHDPVTWYARNREHAKAGELSRS